MINYDVRVISDLNPNKNKLRETFPKEFAVIKYDAILNPPLDSFISNPGIGANAGFMNLEEAFIKMYLYINGWIERIKW